MIKDFLKKRWKLILIILIGLAIIIAIILTIVKKVKNNNATAKTNAITKTNMQNLFNSYNTKSMVMDPDGAITPDGVSSSNFNTLWSYCQGQRSIPFCNNIVECVNIPQNWQECQSANGGSIPPSIILGSI